MRPAIFPGRVALAKVSELIEQASTLEKQGETAKALAIYRHILPHLKSAPAVAADLSVKAGDLSLKSGDKNAAVQWFGRAGDLWASLGQVDGVLSAGARVLKAAPEKADVYLTLGRRMVDAGHVTQAVDVLIEHAKRYKLDQMADELQPLAGRPAEDIKPLVKMLLEGAVASVPTEPAVPVEPPIVRATPLGKPLELPTWAAPQMGADSLGAGAAPPAIPPEPVLPPPPPLPTWAAPVPEPPPVKPQFAPTPMPPLPFIETVTPPPVVPVDPDLELSVLPPSARESQVIQARQSQMHQVRPPEPEAAPPPSPPPPPPPPRRRSSGTRRRPVIAEAPRKGGLGKMLGFAFIAGIGVVGWLVYSGKIALPSAVEGVIDAAKTRADSAAAGIRRELVPEPPARRDTSTDFAPPDQVVPNVVIDGLSVEDFTPLAGRAFRVMQRQNTGEIITLTATPAADTPGEPAVGEYRIDSTRIDTTRAMTTFSGYVVSLKGPIGPTNMRELLRRLVSRTGSP